MSYIGCQKASIGRATIYIDGARIEDVNMHKSFPIEGYQNTIYRVDGLTNGPHTLVVEASTSSRIVVDAFDVRP